MLKSGSNAFHGSAFEYIQNSAVNARSYFGPKLGHLSYNYYGGSIGGPIIKDKLFFFVDYWDFRPRAGREHFHDSRSEILHAECARQYRSKRGAIKQWDWPDLLTLRLATAISANARADARPFVNNQLPFNRVNPISLKILQMVNAAAPQYGTLNPNAPLGIRPTTTLTRFHLPKARQLRSKNRLQINEKNHISGRYSYQRVNTFQAPAFGSFLGGPAGGGFQGTGIQTSYSTGVNYDHIFSPTFFTEARFGVAHLRNNANRTTTATTMQRRWVSTA